MSSTMLQLVQQVTAELNLAVPTYVAGNTNQDVQQVLALMNAVLATIWSKSMIGKAWSWSIVFIPMPLTFVGDTVSETAIT